MSGSRGVAIGAFSAAFDTICMQPLRSEGPPDAGARIGVTSTDMRHVAVFLDHHEAKIFHVNPESFEEQHLKSPHASLHQKHREKTHPAELAHFYDEVVRALEGAEEVLVLGPGSAKLDFVKHMHKHHARLVDHLVGVETADHPTDRQIVAHARAAFDRIDRLRGDA